MGKITRVSGPVVIAEDLEDARMYDVVRVGDLELVGEIIKISSGKVTVQVYEDTSGIRPGEKIETTGRPLSVDLGPGLLKSIYDGIQRPLDVIREQTGDFIRRGYTAPPLDEEKKWHFTATAKPGDEVKEGQVIGEVQETGIIKHKVMVPLGKFGKVKEIKSGDYKISEPFGKLAESSGRETPLTLKTEWPVRNARRVLRKFPPEIPLITGQRVIDTFFPVAKGGTVAVPGPFGSGKCVTGDTPVLMGDGSLKRIEDIYEENAGKGRIRHGRNETFVELEEPLELRSYKDGRLVRSKSGLLYKGKSDTVIRVRTATGREARITPEHRLFRVDGNGGVTETRAADLSPGDFILSSRYVDHGEGAQSIDIKEMGITPREEGKTGEASCNQGFVEARAAGDNVGARLPLKAYPSLSEFLGYYAAAGKAEASGIVFTLHGKEQSSRVADLVAEVFGSLPVTEGEGTVAIRSITVSEYVRALCGEEGRIPGEVLKSGNSSRAAFARGFMNASARHTGHEAVVSAGQNNLTDLSYLLGGLGILHLAERRNDGSQVIRVRGADSLLALSRLMAGEVNPGFAVVQDFSEPSGLDEEQRRDNEYGQLQAVAMDAPRGQPYNAPVYFDRISELEEEAGPFDVYDVSLPEYGRNFVGGYGGIILHNTVVQHQLSKWADSDIVVYVGCGERGNEMTEILTTFPELQDPRSGRPLMERTVLIANTSNMPVAAREASIYTGITIAEYYRDMGYNVALMADSTSRWAEALREISGRLEEMPGEEGYPAYLGRRLSEFYERSGNALVVSNEERQGSITIVGAVSPPGGDVSEPVSQNTLRVTRVFWALDSSLASRRHFPSINWLNSYSLYQDTLKEWYDTEISEEWSGLHAEAMGILQKESELQEVVQLVGYDALPEKEKAVLDVARMIREDFLQQSAFDEVDTYCSMKKQYLMLDTIVKLGRKQSESVDRGMTMNAIQSLQVRQKISRMKEVKDDDFEKYHKEIMDDMQKQFSSLLEVQ